MKRLSLLLFLAAALTAVFGFSNAFSWLQGPLDEDHESVIRMQAQLDNIVKVDATSPRLDTVLYTDYYLDEVILRPGFRIVHDPALGREVRVSGPAVQVRALRLTKDDTTLKPDFGALFRTDQMVTLRLNLTGHGNEYISVYNSSRVASTATELRPTFQTAGPLRAKLIKLFGIYTPEPIDVQATALELDNPQNPEQISGTVDHLRIIVGKGQTLPPRSTYSGLRFDRYDSYVED